MSGAISQGYLIAAAICVLTICLIVSGYPIDPVEQEFEHPKLSLISWRWEEVKGYLIVTMFLLMAATIKICYHQCHSLHAHVPESCVLIVLGTIVGVVIHYADIKGSIPQFTADKFFFVLLPPIILDSAYSLYDKTFFNNIRTILLYAIFGTLMNVFLVGSSLFVVEQFGWFGREDIPLVECFTFSTLISAVDPVAVLAIFQELGVNKSLYFLVFGESLLNDAVVITLYNMVTTFAVSRVISTEDVVIGTLNFVTVSGGGLAIGVLVGAATALVTRLTSEVRVVEPLIVVVLAYFSYVFAELFHFSGIIALISCGLMQAEYVKDNISVKSFSTIKYFTKTLSSISDVIIFYYLGRVLIREDHVWDTGFVFFSTFFCVIYRFVSVFLLTYIANRYMQRVRPINFEEQLLMAYGGLRGAIAFSLAVMLEENHVKHARIFITTSLFIVLFTVFVLGSTTKPVVKWLEVQLHVHQEKLMFIEINTKVIESVMAGVEEIAGYRSVNYWSMKLTRFNEKYLKNILTSGEGHSFKDTFETIYSSFIPPKPVKPVKSVVEIKVTVDDEVFVSEYDVPEDDPEGPEVKKAKKRSFKSSIGNLARVGSKGRHHSTDESVQDIDRRLLATAFSKLAFYQVQERDDVDDERVQREAREAREREQERQRVRFVAKETTRPGPRNRWASARNRLENMATRSPLPKVGSAVELSTARHHHHHLGHQDDDDDQFNEIESNELLPLRALLLKKRTSILKVSEAAMQIKKQDDFDCTDETVPCGSGDEHCEAEPEVDLVEHASALAGTLVKEALRAAEDLEDKDK
ncbi:Sodium/hydrogen exchanger 2 [Halotydeus destructor]|nr:Sodium/hydrogen exchanger 2 [Halotydeus destructor]